MVVVGVVRIFLKPSPSSVLVSPYEMFDMSAKRFQFSEGVALTPPITFTDVPNQPTWGDVSFDTVEPFGTDVKVRLRYTNVTMCDTLVPDVALSGNIAGFDVSQSPIDLVGLSTTTYSQICLEATLTTQGSESAALDEWKLAWVREPKLTQSNYRWYVNGSFLTPTDPWPAGVEDVAENTTIDSSIAVNINETIRLRLALEGSNVTLPAFSEAFKLQYAEGLNCSPSLSWRDVGDSSSTTALWRGYENSIVGDDWYGASWGRRIKITVDSGVVAADVTNFPVYLDLSDLPAGFFSNVQSDGDDIRITQSDGVTELPFELVSINTSLQTGELHFRATLASTTDTEFYLYYANPSASGYAPTATYGSRNVWTNGYSLRYAMDDSPVAASPQFRDSTSNNNNAVAYPGMTAGDVVGGIIGEAIDLDGNDGATFQTALAYTGVYSPPLCGGTLQVMDLLSLVQPEQTKKSVPGILLPKEGLFVRTISSSDTGVSHPSDGTWTHVVLTRDSSNKVDLYLNGSRTRLYGDVAQSGTSDWINFGGETSQGFVGRLDELRFANVQRTEGWVVTEFNNQSNPTGFYDVSAEELISDGRLLPSTLLVNSDYAETYEEENPTRENQNSLPVGDEAEWDFVLQNNGGSPNTNYCFRLVYEDGSLLNTYNNYPRLITNSPPLIPVLTAPFDNEQLASTTPWFEFSSDDELDDEVAYQIQVSTDFNFGSTVIDSNSEINFAQFTNLSQPAQRGQYTSGQTVRFVPTTALSNGTTYWWRVRAEDPDGSGAFSGWSDPDSFTVNTGTTITTWFQTTGEQFATNSLLDAIANIGAGDVGIDSGFTVGTTTSGVIDYDDRDTGNAWGELSFTQNVTSGSIRYYVEYKVSEGVFALVPNTDLPGNSSGFTSSPVSLVGLNTTTYNELRLMAVLTGNDTLPRLQSWTVTWSETIEIPTLVSPFDNAKVSTTTPSFTFFTTDPENDSIQYEVQVSSDFAFTSPNSFLSGVDAGFVNTEDVVDTSPFNSGDLVRYTAQTPLTNSNTYWWRVRARDPLGANVWSGYSAPESFTVDTAITTSVWFQTTGEQFETNDLVDIETTAGSAQITSVITEVMSVYGEGTGQAPQYRLWNGSSWSSPASAQSVGAQISWLELKASPTRPEYALATLGTDADVNFQIYDVETDTWGNMIELQDASVATNKRTFNLAYETNSGDLLAIACNGSNAVYSVWNGSAWSATSSLSLTNANNCEFIQITSDPISDEMIVVFRHAVASANDFEAFVWNGSSFSNNVQFGELVSAAHEGMAVGYEESGGQAIVAVSNGAATTLLYNIWNGSSWSGTTTHALGDHIEWATLKSDVGTDRMALCYIDNDNDPGVLIWDGNAWGTFTEVGLAANDVRGRAIDCEWQVGTNDGDLIVTYSDGTATRYRTYDGTTFSGELSLDIITDTFEVSAVRAGNGTIHIAAYDDALSPDRIDHSRWNGSGWTARERFSENASLNNVLPYIGGVSLAAQIYPNFTSGSIRSTAIDFEDGSGPRWDTVLWNDSTPGVSYIEYRVYYESSPGVFTLVPNAALAGNSAGFTSGPVDISALDRNIYSVLKLDAQFVCVSGNCPTLNDWSVAWSEGITVSGNAYEFDGVSTTTSGSVAVAVNGELQIGKTGTILSDGTWSIPNVTVFPNDTVTVFVDGAADADEAVGIATYNGVGNITGVELTKRHVTIGSASVSTTTIASFAGYDNTDDEDIFFTVGAGNAFTVCAESGCADGALKIKSGTTFVPGAALTTHDFLNFGSFNPATNTIRISGSWNNQGSFSPNASTFIFTATSTSESIQNSSSTINFHNLTLGETAGSATWSIDKPLVLTSNLSVQFGNLNRATSSITLAGNLSVGLSGNFIGIGTTTFNGTGNNTWSDAKATSSSSNVGHVVIDGTTKTITLGGHVGAESVTIGADDTLNASGSGYNINVVRGWVNINSFIPQSGSVTFVGTTTNTINRGSSAFNNLNFTGVGGNWSFTTPTLALNGSLTIATGTVTLPTGTTTIGASFTNSGGTFLHNNGEVRMTSNTSGRTITQSATAFLNHFYDLVFTGSGAWSFTEANATTTRNFRGQAGSVTLPSGQLTVGGDFSFTGTGAFAHNNGELVLVVQDSDDLRTNGSSLNNVRVIGGVSSSWYNDSWNYRIPVTIQASQIDDDLTNFPVHVDLDDLSAHFFSNVKSDGGDIRVTLSDGVTEVPRELVSINTGSTEGELYFRATSVSSSTNTTFYIYYGNPSASDYSVTATFGARNVWSNGYVLVAHMNDLTTSSVLNSAGTINGTKSSANNPQGVTTGYLYSAQDHSGDSVQFAGNIIQSRTSYHVSMWFNPDSLTGGNADEQNFGRSLYGVSPSGSPYEWLRAGGTGFATELRVCAFDTGTVCNATTGAGLTTGAWHYVSVNAVQSGNTTVRVNGTQRLSFTAPSAAVGANFTIGDLRPGRNINFDGRIDEVRVSTTTRTNAWRDAEYRNMATTTSFYTAGGFEVSGTRVFADTNATILGDLVLETGGDSTFNSGILSIGGSFDNNATFNSNNGTVRFNSTAGSETIAAGSSTFSTLEFNSATGDFTVVESATATNAINLNNASQFTLNSGLSLTTQGTFTNAIPDANTTWTGSTLRLSGNNNITTSVKTYSGDSYGTIETTGTTTARFWNSGANSYVTSASSSIYSQDHVGTDGLLRIYGNYIRNTGTEHWSYATDFDGANISGTPRAVTVEVASSSILNFTTASLSAIGAGGATTTVGSISGEFTLNTNNSTLNSNYASWSDLLTGLSLNSSTSIATLTNTDFTVAAGRTGITIDSSTVGTNPAAQYFGVGFATSSAGVSNNVTLIGSPASFIWFREGRGGLYGEAFDAGDGNPGSVRFDDSSYLITVSGVVYSDAGVTTMGAPVCDGTTPNVRIVVDGGTYTDSVACNSSTGAYSFNNVAYVGSPVVVIYLDTNGGQKGATVTKTPTSDITNLDIYANRLTTRHEDVSPLTIADLTVYDNSDDADLPYFAAVGSPNTLNLEANSGLHVFASTTFAPGGNVTLGGNGNSNAYEGSLELATSSVFTAAGSEVHTLAGRLSVGNNALLTTASSTFVFNATTTGKSISSSLPITFNELVFDGVGGSWNMGANIFVLGDMEVVNGTVTGTGNITITNGSLFGNGTLSLGGGTVTINSSNTLGGTSPWTFNNLTLGSGSVVGTTTPAGTATTTILGTLTIANAHFLDAGSSVWDLAGTGNVLVETGTLLEDTSTFRFSGAGANIPSTSYYNLLAEAGVGTQTYTTTGTGVLVLNQLKVGGQAGSVLNINANDTVVEVRGDTYIASNGQLDASNTTTLTLLSSFDNDGLFNGNGGTVAFTGTGTSIIAAGNANLSNVEINGSGNFTITESATSTGDFSLISHNNFTVSPGVTLSVGQDFLNNIAGANTTWTGSTLYMYGAGTYNLNDSVTSDSYETLRVASSTNIRIWNSTASNYDVSAGGSIYSQDHDSIDGDAYIFGQMMVTSGNDYWSYATDFDGTDLSGGSERQANVYLASGASASFVGTSDISVIGTSSASTTIQNQGSGTYGLLVGGNAVANFNRVNIRDINTSGVVFAGAPTITDFSRTDHLVTANGATAITVGGTVINNNEAKNFTGSVLNYDTGVTGAINVTATGTSVSSWRFTNYQGNLGGESFDSDPAGDPGYLVWDDSAALITVAGNVYSDEGTTVSGVCDGSTNNIRLVVAGLTTYDTSCNASTGAYSISNVAFSALDTLTLYINGETEKAANVTISPISSIGNLHLYENRVIVRHESTDPITIANMAVWDGSDDADIPFTAVDAGTDTLDLPSDTKLLVWTAKTFAPGGNVTLSGGGAGSAWDGTLELLSNADFVAAGTQTHSVGGNITLGTGAEFISASSTLVLTAGSGSKTIDINANNLHNLSITGGGSFTMSDATLTVNGSYTQSAGSVTFTTGTTTVGSAFNVTGGSFTNNGSPLVLTSTGAGTTVRFNNSPVASLTFNGTGSFNMTDINATSSGSVTIIRGGVTLPSGNLAVGGNMLNLGGTITHNTSDVIMTSASAATLTASTSDLFAVRFVGGGNYTITGPNLTLLNTLEVAAGDVAMATGTTAVGGSFIATGGTFTHATGTILMNSAGTGNTVNFGVSPVNNLQFSAPSGGYTVFSATTTNNFTIANVNIFTVNPGSTIYVGGVFTNSVGGTATTWTGTTLILNNENPYSINTRLNTGDSYGTLVLGANTNIKSWYSSFATTTLSGGASLYSQDNGNINGDLYIYGDFRVATSTEHWSYATDFDGTALGGGSRAVNVYLASGATTTVTTGSLQIVGALGNETAVQNQGSGTYSLSVEGGTFNANYFEISDMNISGLRLSGLSTITNIANGLFDIAVDTGSLITLSSTTLNANPSKIFDAIGFTATTGLSGFNVNLVGETDNAWRFTNSYGNIGGEGFDIDGLDACGSIRFDDSSCLLTEQTHYRWRADDGGEGAPNSEWLDTSFANRSLIRVLNNDNQTYATATVKVNISYDSAMRAEFEDLRFTTEDGQTEIPFWLEKYTASTDAQVWVQIPGLDANDFAHIYMYYGSSTAVSVSDGGEVFSAFDDYEDNNITEYSGDTSLFTTVTSPVFGGDYALRPSNVNGKTTDGIFRFDQTVSQGQIIRYMQYVDTAAGSGDEPCTLFGVQSPGTTNQNYAVCLEQFGVDRISLARNVDSNDTSGTVLATTTVTYSTGWYEVEIDWRTNNTIFVSLFNAAGTLVATTSATDSNYTSGGYGYAFWFQNGAWDSFTARPRINTAPTVYVGTKQANGGASWSSPRDAAGSALPDDVVRLRVAIENSGLDVTAQQYRLEYAPKGVAPTCESVSGGSYTAVPNQAACGTSPVCMQTSAFVSNGDATSDQLFGTTGDFSAGSVVASPNNQTVSTDIDQNFFTELEYVLTPTVNATDAYCFRVTNAGTPLDFYARIAELGLQFDPSLTSVDLNGGLDISLTPGTTTSVTVTGVVTDFNGFADITNATATIYRSGAGAACAPDNNNCYIATTENGLCAFVGCSGSSCNLSCTVDMEFYAEPTDDGAYVGQEWLAFAEVEDFSGGYDFDSATGVQLLTLRALAVDSLINYGALAADSNTGSFNPTTTITNLGNVAINVDVEGTSLTDGISSSIPADNQKVATSTFDYAACVNCYQLSNVTAVTLGLNLSKPVAANPPVETEVYWGIAVPFSASNAPHSGTNIFTAIGID
jgi:hypothetical protein